MRFPRLKDDGPPPAPMPIVPNLDEPTIPDVLLSRPLAPTHPFGSVTRTLSDRLTAQDMQDIEAALDGDQVGHWAHAGEEGRRYLALLYAAWYRVPGALEHTGLTADMPPDDVHAMARGPQAAGGDPYIADAVVDGLARGGLTLDEGATILDFGCSSGRVLRAIAAARPDLHCIGCDPNADAVAWARDNLPFGTWFPSPIDPPLELADASVDAAYAISIWSHFGATAAIRWFDEMHRIVRPGGALLITTHGVQTLSRGVAEAWLPRKQSVEIVNAMLATGHHFIDVFGEDGDWGVKDPQWGNAYMSIEWLARQVTPQWSISLLEVGRISGNQDLIVLRRQG